jgi:coenzyme F420-0:L-glutamate ligase / coenzyme F420-1:gamma-L-glutamate ligase
MPPEVRVYGLDGIPEIHDGDDLVQIISDALDTSGLTLEDSDVLVITQKIVSKAEGRLIELSTVEPSPFALQFAEDWGKDPRTVEVVLQEARRVIRMERGVLIAETKHGFICANAGVDASNVPGGASGEKVVCRLPVDPDASAAAIREGLRERHGAAPAVIISDTFGRPWRKGQINVAIGMAGLEAFADYRGITDPSGHDLRVTVLAVADELASAAELVHGKTTGRPVALIRGYDYPRGDGKATDLVLEPEKNLFP